MTTNYPNAIDSFPVHVDNVGEQIKAASVNNLQDAVVAIQQALGTGFNVTNWNNLFSSIQNNVSNLQYDMYNADLQMSYNGMVTNKAGMYFDGFSDTTKADTTSATTSTTLTVGQTALAGVSPIPSGFKVGQEVLISDDQNSEFVSITAVTPTLTVSALKNAYKKGAVIARTSGSIDTINRKLNMGTASVPGTVSYTMNPSTVTTTPVSYYTTFRTSGIVELSNGWLVTMHLFNSAGQVAWLVSKDNAQTWNQLCFCNTSVYGMSMAAMGTMVYTTWGNGGQQYFVKFDATTVTNVAQTMVTIDSTNNNIGNGNSIALDGTGKIYVTWSAKTSTYTYSFNIRVCYSTDGGNTWSAAQTLTTSNTTNYDYTMPDLLVLPNGYPVILCQYAASTTTYGIYSIPYAGTWGTAKQIYSVATYSQQWVNGAVDSTGAVLRAFWHGYSSTATTTYNLFTSTSADGGTTWSTPVNLTNITTAGYNQMHPYPVVDSSNNWTVLFDGIDPTVATSYTQIRKMTCPAGSSTWSSPINLTSVANYSCQQPVAIWSTFFQYCTFTEPVAIYQDNSQGAVMLRGTWSANIALPIKTSTYYSKRTTFPTANKNTKVWHTRVASVQTYPLGGIAAGAQSIQLPKMISNATGTVFTDPLTSSAAWTTRSGSFAFGAGGATSNAAAAIITAGAGWVPNTGFMGVSLPVTAQMTFTMPATVQTARLYLYLNATNYYVATFGTAGLSISKLYNNTSLGLITSGTTVPAASTSYSLSLSLTSSGHLTLNLYNSVGTLISSLTTTDTTIIGNLLLGVGGDTGVVVSNAQMSAALPNLAVGDLIEVHENSFWERATITAINGASLSISPPLANAYSSNAAVARVDETVQCFLGASGATESFSPMTWQGSTLNSDGTIEDTYYYSTSAGGTDAVYKILQSSINNPAVAAQSCRYGAVVGL